MGPIRCVIWMDPMGPTFFKRFATLPKKNKNKKKKELSESSGFLSHNQSMIQIKRAQILDLGPTWALKAEAQFLPKAGWT